MNPKHPDPLRDHFGPREHLGKDETRGALVGFVSVYGQSDDLICLHGSITAEFLHHPPAGDPSFLAFSDGSVLECIFTGRGIWRIERIWSGTCDYTRRTAAENVQSSRTDNVMLSGPVLNWVMHSVDLVQRSN